MEVIHYFEEFDRIGVSGSKVSKDVEVRVLCGATEGEADNRKGQVTCPECLQRLHSQGAES